MQFTTRNVTFLQFTHSSTQAAACHGTHIFLTDNAYLPTLPTRTPVSLFRQ